MTTYFDPTFSARAIGARTNSAGSGVTDLTAEEDRLSHAFVTEGWVLEPDSFKVAAGDGFEVLVGSNGSRTDYFVVPGGAAGQENYVVRLAAQTVVELDPANGTYDRIDEVYLVVEDDAYDSNGRSLPRLAYQKGTAAVSPSAPGPAGGWNAYSLLATIELPAGAPSVATATITDERPASQLLVDAGTLDGYVAADFAAAGHNHDADYAPVAHDDATSGHPTATTSTPGLLSAADKSKLDGIEDGAEVNPTASELLTQVKAVDGAGSGLDADTIDGAGSGNFDAASHTHDTRYYTESEIDVKVSGKRNKPEAAFLERLSGAATAGNASGVAFTVSFDTIVKNDWGGASLFTDIDVDVAGALYIVQGQIVFESNSSGFRQAQIKSSTQGVIAVNRKNAISGDTTVVNVSAILYSNSVSEVITLEGYQDSGSSLKEQVGSHLRVIALGH